MGTLIAAYLIAWTAVTAYVGWLAVQNARLAHRLGELETRKEERPIHARAA